MFRNKTTTDSFPVLLGLFQKRIDGDGALLELARLRFKEAGLGPEFYAETPQELDALLEFKPTPESPVMTHLGRGINLLEEESRDVVVDFVTRFRHRVLGFVVHDQIDVTTRLDDYVAALKKTARRFGKPQGRPWVFIEYAVGMKPDQFVSLSEAILDVEGVSCCVDIGHVGLWHARATYAVNHPGEDVCALAPDDPALPDVIEDVQSAVRSALEGVLDIIRALKTVKKPFHFHLHDGHPLSTSSPFGISDHMSFLDRIPIPFEYKTQRDLAPMYGPSGLSKIISESLTQLGPDRLSFSLEIHPTKERLPLHEVSFLFEHWKDKSNGERMNHWLETLLQNHKLLLEACEKGLRDLQIRPPRENRPDEKSGK